MGFLAPAVPIVGLTANGHRKGGASVRGGNVVVDRTDIAIIRDFSVYPPLLQFPGCVQASWDVIYATNVELVDGLTGRIYGHLPSRSMLQPFVGRPSIVGLRATGENGEVISREIPLAVVNWRHCRLSVQSARPLLGDEACYPRPPWGSGSWEGKDRHHGTATVNGAKERSVRGSHT